MASTPVRYPTPNASNGSPQHTSDPLLCPPVLEVVCVSSVPPWLVVVVYLALWCQYLAQYLSCGIQYTFYSTALVTTLTIFFYQNITRKISHVAPGLPGRRPPVHLLLRTQNAPQFACTSMPARLFELVGGSRRDAHALPTTAFVE